MKKDELFKTLLHRTGNDIYTSIIKEKPPIGKPSAQQEELARKITIGLIVLFIFAGGEIVKVLFRKNFGRDGINRWQIVVAFLGLLAVSLLSGLLFFNKASGLPTALGGKISFLFTSIIYLFFSVYVLLKGNKECDNAENFNDNQQGESYVLKIKGWRRPVIQNLGEPMLLLICGILLTPINFLLGIPIIFCALSYWLHKLYEVLFPEPLLRDPKRDRITNSVSQRQFAKLKL